MRRQWIIMSQLLLVIIVSPFIGMAREGAVPADIAAKAQAEGTVRIIVQLDVPTRPEGILGSPLAVSTQRQAIAAGQAAVLADLTGTNHRVARQFATIPFLALEVGPDALAALERSARVLGVTEDRLDVPSLAESVPLVEADQAWAAGFDGTGWSVAVVDTGVDNVHPFLSGKVVEEACFSGNSNCPDGSTTQIGPGAGVPCDYAPNGCRHGTHVAGIAAGQGDSFSGVAKGAGVIAIQVFSLFTGANCAGAGEDPCALSFTSDQIAGLEHVFNLSASGQIASANMSLGGGRFFDQASCDAANGARKAAIDNLRSVGIAAAIASGNNGFTDSMSAPGCISTAVSVGSTTKTDMISSFSNSASFLNLLAPGSSINSSVPGGGFAVFNGTSMATPHVAGTWAILKQAAPGATVSEILNALRDTGLPITDPRNGVTTPRIRVRQALDAIMPVPGPNIVVQPASWNYGNVVVGSSNDTDFTVRNTGMEDLVVSEVSLVGTDPGEFAIVAGGEAFTLLPGGTQIVTVRFAPTSAGVKSAILRFISNDPDENPKDIPLSGTGTTDSGPIDCNTLAGCQIPDRGSFAPAIQFNAISDAVVHVIADIYAGLGCGIFAGSAEGDVGVVPGLNAIVIQFEPPLPIGFQLSINWGVGMCNPTGCINYTLDGAGQCGAGEANFLSSELPAALLMPDGK